MFAANNGSWGRLEARSHADMDEPAGPQRCRNV